VKLASVTTSMVIDAVGSSVMPAGKAPGAAEMPKIVVVPPDVTVSKTTSTRRSRSASRRLSKKVVSTETGTEEPAGVDWGRKAFKPNTPPGPLPRKSMKIVPSNV